MDNNIQTKQEDELWKISKILERLSSHLRENYARSSESIHKLIILFNSGGIVVCLTKLHDPHNGKIIYAVFAFSLGLIVATIIALLEYLKTIETSKEFGKISQEFFSGTENELLKKLNDKNCINNLILNINNLKMKDKQIKINKYLILFALILSGIGLFKIIIVIFFS
ncbi:MAG: hypothetical protein V3V61_07380 [Gammaproteobacteria bacterium]